MRKFLILTICFLFCITAGLFIGSFFATQTPVSDIGNEEVACGQVCLRIAANLYGISCDNARVWDVCLPAGKGTLLTELQNAAPKLGMSANITKLTWNKLISLSSFAVLHINGNHYVLADPQTKRNDAIRIFDSAAGTRWYDKEMLQNVWQGTSMILTKNTDYSSPSFISSPIFWQDNGDFTSADEATYVFSIKNHSPKTIKLTIEKLSCQCSSAALEKEVLESGETTNLTASVKLEGKHGTFHEHVRILTANGEKQNVETFVLAGTVIRQDIFLAKRLFFGTVSRGGVFGESFLVKDPGNGMLKDVKVFLPNPPDGFNIKIISEKMNKSNQKQAKKLNASRNDWIVSLTASVKKDAALQPVKFSIKVQTNLPIPCREGEVFVEGEVIPAIKIEPGALLFSAQSAAVSKMLTIKSTISDFALPKPVITFEGAVPLHCEPVKNSGQEWIVIVRLNEKTIPIKTCSGSVIFDFGSEGIISVPVVFQQ